MIFPPLLLLRPQRRQDSIPTLLPGNLNDQESHKVRKCPITAVRAQHVKVLDVECPAAARQEIVDLPVVVKQEHSLLSYFLPGEIVRLHFYIRWEFCDDGWPLGGGDGRSTPTEGTAE